MALPYRNPRAPFLVRINLSPTIFTKKNLRRPGNLCNTNCSTDFSAAFDVSSHLRTHPFAFPGRRNYMAPWNSSDLPLRGFAFRHRQDLCTLFPSFSVHLSRLLINGFAKESGVFVEGFQIVPVLMIHLSSRMSETEYLSFVKRGAFVEEARFLKWPTVLEWLIRFLSTGLAVSYFWS